MRIDLHLCDMSDCKWCADSNCTATEVRRVRCPYLHYTDLAEQGRLVELPCAEGTQVYILWGPKYRAGKNEYGINTGKFKLPDIPKLNKTVFITRAEAEARLAELEGAE